MKGQGPIDSTNSTTFGDLIISTVVEEPLRHSSPGQGMWCGRSHPPFGGVLGLAQCLPVPPRKIPGASFRNSRQLWSPAGSRPARARRYADNFRRPAGRPLVRCSQGLARAKANTKILISRAQKHTLNHWEICANVAVKKSM